MSRQYWAHLVEQGALPEPHNFINPMPHMSFVKGAANIEYLRKRVEALKDQPLFADLEYTEDLERIAQWTPLLAKKRNPDAEVAATRIEAGTDVDFGALTNSCFATSSVAAAQVHTNHHVTSLTRKKDGTWRLKVMHTVGQTPKVVRARFVFVGAGGGALALLQHSGIPEIKGFGGFPISGQFLKHHEPQDRRAAPGEGLRQGRRGRPADVGAAPRHARRRRPGRAALRSLRGLHARSS